MEEIVASLRGLDLGQEGVAVTADHLETLVHLMREEKIASFSLTELLRHLVELIKPPPPGSALPFGTTSAKTPDSFFSPPQDGESAHSRVFPSPSFAFTFHSPDKPFAPFPLHEDTDKDKDNDKEKEKNVFPAKGFQFEESSSDEDEDGPFSKSRARRQDEKTAGFAGFFETARSSIPPSVGDTPRAARKTESEREREKENHALNGEARAWFWGARSDDNENENDKNKHSDDSDHDVPQLSARTAGMNLHGTNAGTNTSTAGTAAFTAGTTAGSTDNATAPVPVADAPLFPANFAFSLGVGSSSAKHHRRGRGNTTTNAVHGAATPAAPLFSSSATSATSAAPFSLPRFTERETERDAQAEPAPRVEKKLFGAGELEEDSAGEGEREGDEEMSVDNATPLRGFFSPSPPLSHSTATATAPAGPAEAAQAVERERESAPPVERFAAFNIGASESAAKSAAKKTSHTGRGKSAKDSAQRRGGLGNAQRATGTAAGVPTATEGFPDLHFPRNLESVFAETTSSTTSSSASSTTGFAGTAGFEGFAGSAPSTAREAAFKFPEPEAAPSGSATARGAAAQGMGAGDAPPSWWTKTSDNTANTHNANTQFTQSNTQNNTQSSAFDAPPAFAFDSKSASTSRPQSSRRRAPTAAEAATAAEHAASPQEHEEKEETQTENNLLHLAELYSKQGKELYGIGLYERALDAYTKCLNLSPKNWVARATILGNRAAVFMMMHRYMETVNDCDDALKLDPTLVKLYIRKGKSLLRMGHWGPADASFSRVLELSVADFVAPRGPLVDLDAASLSAFEQTIDSAKMEAKAGLRDLEKLRDAVKELIHAEASLDFERVLKLCGETILHKSPMHRAAQVAKASALNELSRYEDAKAYMEEITLSAHTNIQALYAHPRAVFPCPAADTLRWEENGSPPCVTVHVAQVKNMILCMGYELGHVYLITLKNVKASRSCSADVMMKVLALLAELDTSLANEDKNEAWQWVVKELGKLRELINMKNAADQQFKAKNFIGALNSYTAALKLDHTARRWAAILHSNRAATQMSLGLFADAVLDCNHAVSKDPEYSRAYLRRARAHRSMNKFNDSLRDFRRYLSSDPVPSDFQEIQKELDEMIDAQSRASANNNSNSNASRPASASANAQGRTAKENARFAQSGSYNPFHRADPFEDYGSRPSSARSGGADKTKGPQSSGFSSTNSTYAGYSRPSRAQQQQFHQQSAQQSQPSSSSSSSQPHSGSTAGRGPGRHSSGRRFNSRNMYQFESSESESEEEVKPRTTAYSRSTSSQSANTHSASAPMAAASSASASQKAAATTLFSLKETDHYVILGLDSKATDRDIKVAYRKLALLLHPDKNQEPGAEERFKMVSMAYATLSDKSSRREFDLTRPLTGRRR